MWSVTYKVRNRFFQKSHRSYISTLQLTAMAVAGVWERWARGFSNKKPWVHRVGSGPKFPFFTFFVSLPSILKCYLPAWYIHLNSAIKKKKISQSKNVAVVSHFSIRLSIQNSQVKSRCSNWFSSKYYRLWQLIKLIELSKLIWCHSMMSISNGRKSFRRANQKIPFHLC